MNTRGFELVEFETDFSDGIKLINLYEIVAKKKLGRYNKKPKLPNQMLENVTLALKAMEDDGINLVSIGLCLRYFLLNHNLLFLIDEGIGEEGYPFQNSSQANWY